MAATMKNKLAAFRLGHVNAIANSLADEFGLDVEVTHSSQPYMALKEKRVVGGKLKKWVQLGLPGVPWSGVPDEVMDDLRTYLYHELAEALFTTWNDRPEIRKALMTKIFLKELINGINDARIDQVQATEIVVYPTILNRRLELDYEEAKDNVEGLRKSPEGWDMNLGFFAWACRLVAYGIRTWDDYVTDFPEVTAILSIDGVWDEVKDFSACHGAERSAEDECIRKAFAIWDLVMDLDETEGPGGPGGDEGEEGEEEGDEDGDGPGEGGDGEDTGTEGDEGDGEGEGDGDGDDAESGDGDGGSGGGAGEGESGDGEGDTDEERPWAEAEDPNEAERGGEGEDGRPGKEWDGYYNFDRNPENADRRGTPAGLGDRIANEGTFDPGPETYRALTTEITDVRHRILGTRKGR